MQPILYFTTFFAVTECLLEEERRRKEKRRDLIGKLPPELASKIFRYLAVTDLLTMIDVDVKWGVLIDSDPVLRKRLTVAKATYRKIPKENRDSEARRTLSMLKKNDARKRKRKTQDHEPARKKPTLRI